MVSPGLITPGNQEVYPVRVRSVHSYRALVDSARFSMPINNNHLYRILITRSKQTNKRWEMRRAVREEVGLMLWWLRADLRSVGPPTSKMYLRAEYRSTCYECFNATVRPSSFFPIPLPFYFASPPTRVPSSIEKNFDTARIRRECRATNDYMTGTGLTRTAGDIIRAYYPNVLPARLPSICDR